MASTNTPSIRSQSRKNPLEGFLSGVRQYAQDVGQVITKEASKVQRAVQFEADNVRQTIQKARTKRLLRRLEEQSSVVSDDNLKEQLAIERIILAEAKERERLDKRLQAQVQLIEERARIQRQEENIMREVVEKFEDTVSTSSAESSGRSDKEEAHKHQHEQRDDEEAVPNDTAAKQEKDPERETCSSPIPQPRQKQQQVPTQNRRPLTPFHQNGCATPPRSKKRTTVHPALYTGAFRLSPPPPEVFAQHSRIASTTRTNSL